MKKIFSLFLLLCICGMFANAQTLKPLPEGDYETSANDVAAGIPPTPYPVKASVSNSSDDQLTLRVTNMGNWTPEMKFARFEGNVFALVVNKGDQYWDSPTDGFLVMQPGSVMELYLTDGNQTNPDIKRIIAIAEKGAKFGELKKTAKAHADAFAFVKYFQAVTKANETIKQKAAEEKAAKELADKKAAEEKRVADEAKRAADAKAREESNAKAAAEKAAQDKAYADRTAGIPKADYYTGITKYVGQIKSRFKAVKGKILPADELYGDSDTTFASTETLPLFDFGIVQTRHKSSNNATDLLFYMELNSVNDVHSHYDILLARLKASLTEARGWKTVDHDGSFTWYNDKAWVRLHKKFNSYDDNIPDNTLELEITPK